MSCVPIKCEQVSGVRYVVDLSKLCAERGLLASSRALLARGNKITCLRVHETPTDHGGTLVHVLAGSHISHFKVCARGPHSQV